MGDKREEEKQEREVYCERMEMFVDAEEEVERGGGRGGEEVGDGRWKKALEIKEEGKRMEMK